MQHDTVCSTTQEVVMGSMRVSTSSVLAGAVSIIIFVADLFAPPDIAIWFFYLIPVALSGRSSYVKSPLFFAGICSALIVVDFFFDGVKPWPLLVNSLIGTSLLWVAATLLIQRNRSYESLRQNEEYIRMVLDNLPIGLAVNSVNPTVKFEYINENFPKFYRTTRQALAGMDSFWEAVYEDPEFRATIRKRVLEDCTSGDPDRMHWEEIPITRKGSETHYINAMNKVIPGKNLQLSLVWEVTERKKHLEALHRSEELLRTVLQSAPLALFALDKDGRITLSMGAIWERMGLDQQQIANSSALEIYKNLQILDAKGDVLSGDEVIKRVLAGETITGFTEFKDIKFENRFAPLWNVDHQITGMVGVFIDITEREVLASQLASSESKFRVVFEYAPDAIYLHDFEGVFVDGNRAAEELTGYSRNELIGKSFFTTPLLSQDQLPKATAILTANAKGEPSGPDEFTIQRRDGSCLALEIRTFPVNLGGRPLVLGIARDISERKRAEQALLDSEQRYRLLFQGNPHPMWFFDVETLAFLDVNQAAIRHYGFSREEFLAMKITDIRPPEDIPALIEDVARQSGQVSSVGEWRHTKKDGTIIDVEITSHEIDYAGRKAKVILAHDITARKRAQEGLKRAEQQYRDIFDGVPIGIYRSMIRGGFTAANREFLKMLGYDSLDDLAIGLKDIDNDLYVKAGRRKDLINRVQTEKEVTGFESQVYCKDGNIIWVSENVHGLYNGNGLLVGLEATALDITAHKKATESMMRLLRAVEQTHDIIFMTDVTGRINYINPAFEQTYGYSWEETIGKTPSILKSGKQDALFYERVWNTILSGQNIRAEFTNKTKGGELVIVEAAINPILDSETGLSGFIAVQRDVTEERKNEEERKSLQDQLFQAQKLESIGTLASGIAHDFNNVLGIVLGYSALLKHHAAGNENVVKGIEAIDRAVQRGASLVRQVLLFARKSDTSFAPFDVNQMLTELKAMTEQTFPRTITIATNLDPKLPPIKADKTQMHQVLLNLLVNARDAMPMGGTISVSTSKATVDDVRRYDPNAEGNEFIHIRVSDTGIGMDEATRRRIFEPFFTTKGAGKGTGLGLAVAYGIIKSHDGYVNVESKPAGGTTFDLMFPVLIEGEQPQSAPTETPAAIPGGSETLLVVEDELSFRELLKSSLEAKGYNVITAADGGEALKTYRARRQDIRLVITDLGLPRLDGSRVFEEIRRTDPHAKVLISSGYIDPEVKSQFLNAGASGFLQKPYVLTEIFRKVRDVLDASPIRQD